MSECPKCSTPLESDHRFCRGCGLEVATWASQDSGDDGSAGASTPSDENSGTASEVGSSNSVVAAKKRDPSVANGENVAPATVEADTGPSSPADSEMSRNPHDRQGIDPIHVLTVLVGATLVAVVVAWAVQFGGGALGIGISYPIALGVTWVPTVVLLYLGRTPGRAVSVGLYLLAATLAVLPLVAYVPDLQSAAREGVKGGFLDLLVWAVLVPATAIGLALGAHVFRWYSDRALHRRG